MKLNWKYRILWVIVTGICYSGMLYLGVYFVYDERYSITRLIVQGLLFAVFFEFIFPTPVKKIGKNIRSELARNEQIESEWVANLFRRIESVGGKV